MAVELTRAEHRTIALHHLALADEAVDEGEGPSKVARHQRAAQVHALLALTAPNPPDRAPRGS